MKAYYILQIEVEHPEKLTGNDLCDWPFQIMDSTPEIKEMEVWGVSVGRPSQLWDREENEECAEE